MAKEIVGTVVSTKMTKTVVVKVDRKFRHPMYRKVMSTSKKIKAHNEIENIKEGDVVRIRETRPLSKEKSFIVVEKTKPLNS
jgi:small subunit ribosomal protein S17